MTSRRRNVCVTIHRFFVAPTQLITDCDRRPLLKPRCMYLRYQTCSSLDLSFKFYQDRFSGYRDLRRQNLTHFITLANGLYNSLHYRIQQC